MQQRGLMGISVRTARRLSAAIIVLLGAGYAASFAMPELPRGLEFVIGLMKLSALVGALVLFLGRVGLRARPVEVCAKAYGLTHKVMIAALMLAFFYLAVGRRLGFWLPEIPQMEEAITVFVLLSMALPRMIMAFADSDDGPL